MTSAREIVQMGTSDASPVTWVCHSCGGTMGADNQSRAAYLWAGPSDQVLRGVLANPDLRAQLGVIGFVEDPDTKRWNTHCWKCTPTEGPLQYAVPFWRLNQPGSTADGSRVVGVAVQTDANWPIVLAAIARAAQAARNACSAGAIAAGEAYAATWDQPLTAEDAGRHLGSKTQFSSGPNASPQNNRAEPISAEDQLPKGAP